MIKRSLLLLSVGLLLTGCWSKKKQDMPIPEVVVLEVVPKEVPIKCEYSGRVSGLREVEVRSRVSGAILKRKYVEGSTVKQGDILFEIDQEPFRLALSQAESKLKDEEAKLKKTKAQLERMSTLYKENVVSEKDKDEAQFAYDQSVAGVEHAKAAVRNAQINLGYTTVRSPITGVTSQETRSEGSLVGTSADQSLLTKVTQLDSVYVNFAYHDSEFDVRAGASAGETKVPVVVRLGDGAEYKHEGFVDFTSSTIDPTTDTVRARAVIPNPDGKIRPGQFVRILLKGITKKDGVVIPERAIMQNAQGTFVLVVKADNKADVKPIKIGSRVDGGVLVDGGLEKGDRVVIEGMIKVKKDFPVKISSDAQQKQQEEKK